MSLKFGTDGVRAEALTVLTEEFVMRLGAAAAHVLGDGPWLIGRDTRESGPALENALRTGLSVLGGARATSAGVLPTPALAWLAAASGNPAAMITASHNPWHDNGVKIFAAGGLKLADDVERAIEAAISQQNISQQNISQPADSAPNTSQPAPPSGGSAAVHAQVAASSLVDPAEAYVQHLVGLTGRLDGLSVVLDCANGAMSAVAPAAFRALGSEVTVIHDQPDGRNINDQCGATHVASLSAAVVAAGASLGLAFDGDGDRVIAVDHLGRTVDGDRLIALAALQLREEGRLHHDTVVVTVMSNLGFHKAMAAAGIHVVTTAVGDRYVLEALDAGGFSVGGEQSGHIIYRDLATTGDGLLAGLRLAEFVHNHGLTSGRSLADLAGEVMTSYPQVLVNVRVAERHPQVADELAAEIAAAEARLDGDGRVLLRASGTEPLVRVMVEAATDELAHAVADDLAAVVRARFT